MKIKKEQYRKFDSSLFLYMGAFDEADMDEIEAEESEADEKKEKQEEYEASKKNLPKEIKEQYERVAKKIDEIKKLMPVDQQAAAAEFFNQISRTVDVRFEEIIQDYLEAKKMGEASWEGSKAQKEIKKAAEKLANHIIKRELNDKEAVKEVVNDYLDKMPNTEAKDEEKELIYKWIKQTDKPGRSIKEGNLFKYYGERGAENTEHLERVLEVLAQQYDIRFDGAQPTYGADVLNKENVYPALGKKGEMTLKKAILEQLKPGGNYSPEKIQGHEYEVTISNNRIKALKKEIEKGSALALGGEINEWQDWANHKGLEELTALTKDMQPQIEKALKDYPALKEQRLKMQAYKKFVKESGLKEKFDAAKSKGYKELPEFEKKPDPEKGDITGQAVLDNGKGQQIKVEVKVGQINLKIKNQEPFFETEKTFTAAEFKNMNLVEAAENQTNNYKRNIKLAEEFKKTVDTVQVENIKAYPIPYTKEQLIQPKLEPLPALFRIEGQEVARLIPDFETETYKLELKNGADVRNLSKDEVAIQMKNLEGEMKTIAESAAKAKEEISYQAKEDEKLIPKLKGLTVEMKKDLEGDFANKEENIVIGEIKRETDGTVIGKILMPVAGEGNSRPYILEINKEQQSFNFIDDLNLDLEKNKEILAKIPEKKQTLNDQEELTGTPEEIALKKKARVNLLKFGLERYPFLKMGSASLEDPELLNKLNGLMNMMPISMVEKFAAAKNIDEVDITEAEGKEFLNNIIKLSGLDKFEKQDMKEMETIRKLDVKIGDKVQKFGETFGEDVVRILSMTQRIRLEGDQLQIEKKDEFVNISSEELIEHILPPKIRENCEKILKGEMVDINSKEFKAEAKLTLEGIEGMVEMKGMLGKTDMKEELGKIGIEENKETGKLMITTPDNSIMGIIKLAFELFKSGNIQDIFDAIKAFGMPGGVEGTMEAAKKTYSKVVEAANFEDLLTLHNEPNGDRAKTLLKDSPDTLFKGQLQATAQDRLVNIMGGKNLIGVTKWEGGMVEFDKLGKSYVMYMVPVPNGTDYVSIKDVKTNQESRHDIPDGLTGPGRTLETVFTELNGAVPGSSDFMSQVPSGLDAKYKKMEAEAEKTSPVEKTAKKAKKSQPRPASEPKKTVGSDASGEEAAERG